MSNKAISMLAPKVTVVMPVYNVERFVERAVRSVLNQTLDNLELLAIDDGSTDRSGAILDALSQEDPRVRVYHQKNQGAPSARNYALSIARGEYLAFIDADDWMEASMLSDLVALGDAHQLELVISGFFIDTYYGSGSNDYLQEKRFVSSSIYASQDEFRQSAHLLFDKNQFYSPWNKLYLRSYIQRHHIEFPQTFWDDFPFVLDCIRDIERVGVTDKCYYHFIRARSDSETTRYRPQMYEKREEEHSWMLDLYRHWNITDEVSLEVVYRRYAERLIGCIENLTAKECTLSPAEVRAQISHMISTPQAQTALVRTCPQSKMMALMLMPLRAQNTWLCYCEGKFISWVKRHSTRIFASLKARR